MINTKRRNDLLNRNFTFGDSERSLDCPRFCRKKRQCFSNFLKGGKQ